MWKRHLDALEKGGVPDPDFGAAEPQEYLTARLGARYGSFEGLGILGVGCGTGRIEAWLGYEEADVVYLDRFVQALKVSRIYAQRSQSDGHFAVGDLIRMPFAQDTFDCIFSSGVLEHFRDASLPPQEFFHDNEAGPYYDRVCSQLGRDRCSLWLQASHGAVCA